MFELYRLSHDLCMTSFRVRATVTNTPSSIESAEKNPPKPYFIMILEKWCAKQKIKGELISTDETKELKTLKLHS